MAHFCLGNENVSFISSVQKLWFVTGLTVLLIGAGNEACRQLRDIVAWGVKKFLWVQNEQLGEKFVGKPGEKEPEAEPSWDPSQIILFSNNVEVENSPYMEMLA